MQNAGNGATVQSGDRNDTYRSVVEDLTCLMERIQASLELVEETIVREMTAAAEDAGTEVFVLDDVTPGYVKASMALQACDASLGLALQQLQGPLSASIARQTANCDTAPARSPTGA